MKHEEELFIFPRYGSGQTRAVLPFMMLSTMMKNHLLRVSLYGMAFAYAILWDIKKRKATGTTMIQIKEQQPAYMAVKRPKPLAVVGADLDLALCSKLTAGDKVLMEVNGTRVYSTESNPMVTEHPWEVVSNDYDGEIKGGKMVRHTGHLVLRHPSVESEFRLAYDSVVSWKDSQKNQPCVFVETNDAIQEGTLYVILQMVAYYVPENRVEELFPSPSPEDNEGFQDLLDDDRIKVGLLGDFHKAFRNIGVGWNYMNDFRIASLANARVNIIRAIKDGDYQTMLTATDEEMIGLNRVIHWLPIFTKHTGLVAHSEETFEYRTIA